MISTCFPLNNSTFTALILFRWISISRHPPLDNLSILLTLTKLSVASIKLLLFTSFFAKIDKGEFLLVSDCLCDGPIQSYYHILRNRILSNKHEGREYKKFVDIFEVMIKFCGSKIINPILISVPPKPGNNNRFEKILQKLCYELNFENGMSYIFCNKDYGNNKIRGTQDREANLDGCFTIDSEAFKDRNVIIIDDVLASGATLREITKRLYLKGASSVTGFVMAINQLCTPWQRVRFNPLLCPKCNSEMKLRINSYNLSMFYGCGSYPKCNYTIDYNEGLSKIKTMNQMKYIDNGNDDFDF